VSAASLRNRGYPVWEASACGSSRSLEGDPSGSAWSRAHKGAPDRISAKPRCGGGQPKRAGQPNATGVTSEPGEKGEPAESCAGNEPWQRGEPVRLSHRPVGHPAIAASLQPPGVGTTRQLVRGEPLARWTTRVGLAKQPAAAKVGPTRCPSARWVGEQPDGKGANPQVTANGGEPVVLRSTHPRPATGAEPYPARSTHLKEATRAEPGLHRSTHPSGATCAEPPASRSTQEKGATRAEPPRGRSTHALRATREEPVEMRTTHHGSATGAEPHHARSTHAKGAARAEPKPARSTQANEATRAEPIRARSTQVEEAIHPRAEPAKAHPRSSGTTPTACVPQANPPRRSLRSHPSSGQPRGREAMRGEPSVTRATQKMLVTRAEPSVMRGTRVRRFVCAEPSASRATHSSPATPHQPSALGEPIRSVLGAPCAEPFLDRSTRCCRVTRAEPELARSTQSLWRQHAEPPPARATHYRGALVQELHVTRSTHRHEVPAQEPCRKGRPVLLGTAQALPAQGYPRGRAVYQQDNPCSVSTAPLAVACLLASQSSFRPTQAPRAQAGGQGRRESQLVTGAP
jgi:hypothetical protein